MILEGLKTNGGYPFDEPKFIHQDHEYKEL
jgi:hypothetical protein